MGRHLSVPSLSRRGNIPHRGVQRCHCHRVARQRRSGVHHCPATGVAQCHQHPDCQPVVLRHPYVHRVPARHRHLHADGSLGAGGGPVQGQCAAHAHRCWDNSTHQCAIITFSFKNNKETTVRSCLQGCVVSLSTVSHRASSSFLLESAAGVSEGAAPLQAALKDLNT